MKNLEFENEISNVLLKYHCFSRKVDDNGVSYLKGILDIPNDVGNIVGSFSVEIHSTENFPYRFPKLLEVGNEIPREADWHKYSDNSCCLTVEPDEILKCKNGMSIIPFVEKIAIPYFANQIYRKQTGKYLNEYSHGSDGLREYYCDLFKSKDRNIWVRSLNGAFGNKKTERNAKCYCNSGVKYKLCHLKVEEILRTIGKTIVLKNLKEIIS